MEVVALVPGRDHASTRYRIIQFGEHLSRVGLHLTIEPIARDAARRLKQLSRPRHDQVVILQRKLLPIWQVLLLRQSTRTLVYDFDDAVFYRDSFHASGPYSLTRTLRFRAAIAAADLVIAGNKYLADYAAERVGSKKVEIIPTCVDSTRYQLAEHVDKRPTRLVWIGSSSTLKSLEGARPLLEGIGQSIPHTKLRVICDRFPQFRHMEVEAATWSSFRETTDLRESDIGISWLSDDPWSRGKCGLKVLQYMAAGLPVVASPVGVHREIIGDEHGFLPQTFKGWIETMARLVKDASLREQLGRAGRERIEKLFAPGRWGQVLAERLQDAAVRA
jgi:glycosyltransferase involved in cell wall biosynthesis